MGNHDCGELFNNGEKEGIEMAKALLTNATLLHHQLIIINGISIFGSGWTYSHRCSCPGDGGVEHCFVKIPEDCDILLTHGPPYGIFDKLERSLSHWGSSRELYNTIVSKKPVAHLFGHVHEQRGYWLRK